MRPSAYEIKRSWVLGLDARIHIPEVLKNP
jgi:hypothetical protein